MLKNVHPVNGLATPSICKMMLAFMLALSMAGGPAAAQAANTDASRLCAPDEQHDRIRLGVRSDAPPFSFKVKTRAVNQGPNPYAGYSVELCTDFVGSKQNKTGIDDYCFVEVDPKTRLPALDSGAADLLCGATTASVDVRAE